MTAILTSPSADRNKCPIYDVISSHVLPTLPSSTNLAILEVASGSGIHAFHFTSQILQNFDDKVTYYPTDTTPSYLDSIRARIDICQDEKLRRAIQSPLTLTLLDNGPAESLRIQEETCFDLIICINMIHISPWSATLGLMKLAKEKLKKNGVLYCYGPYKVDGKAVESNLSFDRSLKSRDSAWGLRDLEQVVELAENCGELKFEKKIEMPANNLSVIYRKL